MNPTLIALLALCLCLAGCGKKAESGYKLTSVMQKAGEAFTEGRYSEAIRLYSAELASEEAKKNPNRMKLTALNSGLGSCFDRTGQYGKALEAHKKSLALRINHLSPTHLEVANSYINIGSAYDSKGEYDQALEFHQKALAIRIERLGKAHPSLASCFNHIGLAYQGKGDHNKALVFSHKSLAIDLKEFGPNHLNVATSYGNIWGLHYSKGEFEKALEFHKKALAIQHKNLDPSHRNLATTYNNVALVYKAMNDLAKAREYFEKAYTICMKKLGADHPNTKITKAAIDKLGDEEAEAVELPAKERMAAMSFFGAAGMLDEALTDLKGKREDDLKRRRIKKIKEAQRLFKAADRDVLNKMYPGWGDYSHDSQFPLVTRILESTIENKPLAPTQKDLQGEIWWQKNYQGIILLMRKDPDIRPLFGPFPKK